MTMHITIYYMGTTFDNPKYYHYIRIPINLIPQKIINEYNFLDIVHDGYVYIEYCKAIYVETGALSNKQHKKTLQFMAMPPIA